MDGSRLDALARALTTSRRSTLRALLSGALAALFTKRAGEEAEAGCKKVGKKCDKSKDCCDGARCKGGKNGKCRCKSGHDDCDGDGRCESLDSDDANCGACGVACPTGEACCDAACIDVETDRANCGGCGVACGDPEVCSAGTCRLCLEAAPRCGDTCCASESCCDGVCAGSLQFNREHCGFCFNDCRENEICDDGSCDFCPPDFSVCGNTCCKIIIP